MTTSNEESPYLTTAELAARLRIDVRTLERWRTDRTGPRFARYGRHVRYHREDVEAYEREARAAWEAWQERRR